MNKRQTKKQRKKELKKQKLVIRAPGLLGGYTCPTCGERYCREPYCRNCTQCLAYSKDQLNKSPSWKSNEEWREESRKVLKKQCNGLVFGTPGAGRALDSKSAVVNELKNQATSNKED